MNEERTFKPKLLLEPFLGGREIIELNAHEEHSMQCDEEFGRPRANIWPVLESTGLV